MCDLISISTNKMTPLWVSSFLLWSSVPFVWWYWGLNQGCEFSRQALHHLSQPSAFFALVIWDRVWLYAPAGLDQCSSYLHFPGRWDDRCVPTCPAQLLKKIVEMGFLKPTPLSTPPMAKRSSCHICFKVDIFVVFIIFWFFSSWFWELHPELVKQVTMEPTSSPVPKLTKSLSRDVPVLLFELG